MILDVLGRYTDIVRYHEILKFKMAGDAYQLVCRLDLLDGSILFVRDYLFSDGTRKYSFHWQAQEGSCIVRWDNAPHHQQVNTFPYHRHVGEAETIEAAPPVNLEKVLSSIRASLVSGTMP
jgi:hypothetical protein